MTGQHRIWTNRSVLAMAGDSDPVKAITDRARSVVIEAIQAGWSGPPYDPFALAELRKLTVVAREDIPDARTVPSRSGPTIEFNPSRPRSRVKYSICHEVAHTLFPDCDERIRNRVTHLDMKGDEWQLETLCNIAAAELLMPIGSVVVLRDEHLAIDTILRTRQEHEVSAEAVMLRAVRLTSDQCCVFSSSCRGDSGGRYMIDYAIASRTWGSAVGAGAPLPDHSLASECIAIGFTAKGHEIWEGLGKVRVECLGVPPYPNQRLPRVLGVVYPHRQAAGRVADITCIRGDASRPRGTGPRIIAQIVNDAAFTWGAGFSRVVRERWPGAQQSFRTWAERDRKNLRLGMVHESPVDDDLSIFSMIAQRGYGPSPTPRLRYAALERCLQELGSCAAQRGATVHMPKIGSGLGGGSWNIIRELVKETVCGRGVDVVVYELPGRSGPTHPQASLQFS